MRFEYRVSAYNRRRKWALFQREMAPDPGAKILDVGFNEVEYSHVDNFLEKSYPHRSNITALGMNEAREFNRRYPEVKTVVYDGRIFPFADRSFDICWSNAVLEHVGGWERQVQFLREIRRVAAAAFVTTPNRYFPIEVHTKLPFLHWLPKKVFDRLLRSTTSKSYAAGDYMHLLSLSDLKRQLAEAGISQYKVFRNRLGPFTLDYVVVFHDLGTTMALAPREDRAALARGPQTRHPVPGG